MVERSKGCSSSPPDSHPCPWLMFSHGKSTNMQTFYNPSKKSCLKRRIPDLCNGFIRASFDGWVIVKRYYYEGDDDGIEDNGEDDDGDKEDGEDDHGEEDNVSYEYFCLNLKSMEKIQLPSLEGEGFRECIFSASPLLPNCIVAFVSLADEGNTIIKCWRPNQEGWIERVMESSLSNFAVCEGKIYGFQNRYLTVLDIVEDQIQIQPVDVGPVPHPMMVGTVRIAEYLIESCGDLFLVMQLFLGPSTRRVRTMEVYKLEGKDTIMEWTKTNNIGDRVFFMNNGFNCFSCSATQLGLPWNSIYFTIPNGRDRTLYRYSIADNGLHKSLPCREVVHNLNQICWVMI